MAIITPFRHKFWGNDNLPLNGGKVYIYEPGTTTLKNSYTSSTGAVANTNPVILDSKGEADIWTTGLFKADLFTSGDVHITGWPVDMLGAGQTGYHISGFLSGKPSNGEIVLRLKMAIAVSLDVNFAASTGTASVAATASTTYVIAQNGTQIGTMVFAIGGTSATFVAAAAVTLAAGDVLSVTAPATADATLANVGFILVGYI